MKKWLLSLLLVSTTVFGSTYSCEITSMEDKNTGVTTMFDTNETVTFGKYQNSIFIALSESTLREFVYTTKEKSQDGVIIDVYRSINGEVIGVYENFEKGVRFVGSSGSMDFTNCKKLNR